MKTLILFAAVLGLAAPASACLWPWSPAKLEVCAATGATGYEWETSLGKQYKTTGPQVTVECDASTKMTVRARAVFPGYSSGWTQPSHEFNCAGMIVDETLLPWTWDQWILAFENGDTVCGGTIRVC